MTNPIRVLIVDDSALVRKLLSHFIGEHARLEVIGTAIDAIDARAKIKQLNPDVLTLDVEMPGMDGLAFLHKIMTLRPMPVVMVSTLTERGAEASLRALQLGAFDFFPKPKNDLASELEKYVDTLQHKIIAASTANVSVLAGRARDADQNAAGLERLPDMQISSASALKPIIAIGSSTGGTEAVRSVLEVLPVNTPGIVIAQHIPGSFSASFAERLNQVCAVNVKEAENGDRILAGHAYVAPGGRHLTIKRSGAHFECRLDDTDPVNRHKPSVDRLFDSVAEQAKNIACGVILTGMGRDGADGLLKMLNNGAHTIAQDENTSVVWGMPGSAVKIDAAKEVVPLQQISSRVRDAVARIH